MCIGLIGGMDRLKDEYVEEAKRHGVRLKVFTKLTKGMLERIKNVDGIIIFTNKTSHNARNDALKIAKTSDIPVLMWHSCGICSLRKCIVNIKELKEQYNSK